MSTDRPRLQAYVDPAIHFLFLKWKREQGIAKDSEALNQILAEYFGVSSQSPIPNPQSPIMTLQIEEMIDERINLRFEKLDYRLKEVEDMLDVKHGVPTLLQEALETVRFQKYVIEDLDLLSSEELKPRLNELAERLEVVENSLKIIFSDSLSNSLEEGNDTRSPEPMPGDEAPGLEEDNASNYCVEEFAGEEIAGDSAATLVESSELLPIDSLGSLLTELPSAPLTQTELAKRLGCHKSLISRHKESGNFEEWSRGKDPSGVAWRYARKEQNFFAVEDRV